MMISVRYSAGEYQYMVAENAMAAVEISTVLAAPWFGKQTRKALTGPGTAVLSLTSSACVRNSANRGSGAEASVED
jgi:hypothetical protein